MRAARRPPLPRRPRTYFTLAVEPVRILVAVPEDVRLAVWPIVLRDDAGVAAGLCVVFAAAGGEVVLVFLLGGAASLLGAAASRHAGTANASTISVKTRFMSLTRILSPLGGCCAIGDGIPMMRADDYFDEAARHEGGDRCCL